jgi:predicted nucleotidyltransferase
MIDVIEQHRSQIEQLCRKYDVHRLDVFGSAVDGRRYDPGRSDIDFLVDFNNFTIHNAADRYFDLLIELETLLGRKVDLVSNSAIRNPYFRKSVDSERVNLYAT